ncbi:Dyp-type peroxidase [Nocardioides sp. J2M5]|uniref:Dyp-type peroxidase n=1 Tax=Nocardioides palaemonis TaxID=2829810 RepID=UPI001BA5419E|nr:Dyp-type peroxidase [Nocardioides palaemonis]MBS2936774.1 Dyp-type peroxidase [Nocardioides palaemonis]
MPGTPRAWGRRQLLHSGAVALGGVGAGWTAAAAALPASTTPDTRPATADVGAAPPLGNRTVAFHGPRQAGVATPPQAHLALLGLDLRADVDLEALRRLMRLISDDAARLTRGLPALADTEPELAAHPASLSVTFGFGPRVVRDLLPGDRVRLDDLPAFGTDRLDEAWGQTDLAVQICADDPVAVSHARRVILKDSHAFARLRWVQDGTRYAAGSVPDGTSMRNVLGQVDGSANPREAEPDFAGLVWSDADGFAGGTFMVVRRIRAEMETWDKVDRRGREAAVGRRLDTGAPLTGTREDDVPDLDATDASGLPVIDPAAHVARARGRTPQEKILRRGYNYTVADPSRRTGEDSGLVFICFAADVERQFVPIQQRLAESDRLNEWVTTIGSAVYAVPPGAAEGEPVGQGVMA